MLAIRMQRLGRKGHPTYRVVVQDSRQTPTSGKVVASLGSYDPHTKQNSLVKDKAQLFLNNGAQPSERVVKLFVSEGVTLPKWVKQPSKQSREIRNLEKLRKNRPAEAVAEKPAEPEAKDETPAAQAEEATATEASTEAPAEVAAMPEAEVAAKDPTEPEEAPKDPKPAKPDEYPEDNAKPETPEAKEEKPAESEKPETKAESKKPEKEPKEKA